MSARLAVALLFLALAGNARAEQRLTFLDRASLEWVLGYAGWRTGILPDGVNPGFSVLGGGSELILGVDVVPGVGIIADGRVLAGPRLGGVYVEGTAGIGAQLRVSDAVRLRVGADAGQARLTRKGQPNDYVVIIGGFFAASVDLVHLGRGRAAVEAMLRIDADGHADVGVTFPRQSLSISTGLGFRF